LFGEFLRQRLDREMPERVSELHRRAAESEPVPAEAVAHLLAGRLWVEAAERIAQLGGQLLQEGQVQTVRAWIEALPTEVREAHPQLLSLLGISAWRRGTLPEATALLRRAADGLARADDAG